MGRPVDFIHVISICANGVLLDGLCRGCQCRQREPPVKMGLLIKHLLTPRLSSAHDPLWRIGIAGQLPFANAKGAAVSYVLEICIRKIGKSSPGCRSNSPRNRSKEISPHHHHDSCPNLGM